MVLLPKLGAFAKAYPDIVLDVVTMSDSADLVAGEFDAGIQIGEFIQRDMIAIRVSNDLRLALVGSPEYFKSHKVPRTPRDLNDHHVLGFV
jgi:DNA-binding transcriptional LysR family regulator